ncbi:hypothetical protein RND81_02G230600 [Saponaria officinalis]|uniref:Endonuclease/exonuclease/phosphatase domain-containing protein n=1 Tax=Saponaria officinalis TaxID=3572 RepID=A0AAW1MWE3_SAPOF
MKLCTWNVRGCNSPLKLSEVASFLRSAQLDVMGVLETRIRQSKATKIANAMFPHYQVINNYSYHNNGRIWILWRPTTVSVRVIEVNSQFIHCHITHYSSCTDFAVTFVYASNDPLARQRLWSSLNDLSHSLSAWLVLGDFNVIRDVEEQISTTPPCLHDILDFNACLLNCALDDIQSSGCVFTWTNKQDGEARVWCKLDRALANHQWLSKFSCSYAQFLPAGVSDHSPVVVTIMEDKPPKSRFSFLNCWLTDPSFQVVVQKAWDIPVHGSLIYCFFSKLKNVRRALTDMHRRKYSSIKQKTTEVKMRLTNCQANIQLQPTSVTLLQEEKDLSAS